MEININQHGNQTQIHVQFKILISRKYWLNQQISVMLSDLWRRPIFQHCYSIRISSICLRLETYGVIHKTLPTQHPVYLRSHLVISIALFLSSYLTSYCYNTLSFKITNRSFFCYAPDLWNSLLSDMWQLNNFDTSIFPHHQLLALPYYKYHACLKTFLFHTRDVSHITSFPCKSFSSLLFSDHQTCPTESSHQHIVVHFSHPNLLHRHYIILQLNS